MPLVWQLSEALGSTLLRNKYAPFSPRALARRLSISLPRSAKSNWKQRTENNLPFDLTRDDKVSLLTQMGLPPPTDLVLNSTVNQVFERSITESQRLHALLPHTPFNTRDLTHPSRRMLPFTWREPTFSDLPVKIAMENTEYTDQFMDDWLVGEDGTLETNLADRLGQESTAPEMALRDLRRIFVQIRSAMLDRSQDTFAIQDTQNRRSAVHFRVGTTLFY